MWYCACFCEENVWHLCRDEAVLSAGHPVGLERRRVVFVSNAAGAVAMAHQQAGRGRLIHWDYHVILLAHGTDGWNVWDLDCDLGRPLPLTAWLEASFPRGLPPETAPLFRVVEAARFLQVFSSDRSHMRDPRGAPLQPFPPWPPLQARAGEMNLMRFVDVTAPFEGEVFDVEELKIRYRG